VLIIRTGRLGPHRSAYTHAMVRQQKTAPSIRLTPNTPDPPLVLTQLLRIEIEASAEYALNGDALALTFAQQQVAPETHEYYGFRPRLIPRKPTRVDS
jgi:hypothetical protein